MSKKQPIEIELNKIKINPEYVYKSKVIKSGNGAIMNSFKRFIGKEATVIIHETPSCD